MFRSQQLLWMVCGLAIFTLNISLADAQQRGRGTRGQQTRTRFELATLPEVQTELKLTDEQKKLATDLLAKQREKRQELGQEAFSPEGRQEMTSFNTSSDAAFTAKLDETQRSRFNGLLVQVNGSATLLDPEIAKSLKLSDDEISKLKSASQSNQAARREAFQGLQDLSEEQRAEAIKKVTDKESESLLAILNSEHKKAFEDLKGKPLTIDQAPLRTRRNQ